jgi:hypothetical protein
MGQARSPMADFLIDCYFNGFCKGRYNFVSTPCDAKKLHDSKLCHITQSCDSGLCRILLSSDSKQHSTEIFKNMFYLRLRAMPLSVNFKSIIFLLTPRYAA